MAWGQRVTYPAAVCHAVRELIATDPTAHELRTAVMSMIPKEHHVTHHQ